MQILRAIVFDLFEPSTPRPKHPQQGEALQVPALRALLRSADQLGSPLEEARDGRTQSPRLAQTRIRVGRERRDLFRRNKKLY